MADENEVKQVQEPAQEQQQQEQQQSAEKPADPPPPETSCGYSGSGSGGSTFRKSESLIM